MSATTEMLLNEIEKTTEGLESAQSRGDLQEAARLHGVLKELKTKFSRASEVLTENRSVLKG